ncbi:hypothetical protein T459_17807 [Capsicum annuum]|uniref:FHA domain-containing protein n=1 Tax=Capsicum annuum TaxID=4072 RepID=A0A2G2ZD05_CAPAN|nr:hypothetical protein T459_17807 [Capsicum annuum]
MVSPKQPNGSLSPTGNKRPSSSSDDVPSFSKHPEVDDALRSVKRLKGDDNVDTLQKKLMLPSENSKELHSTDQPELEAGNVADQKVNDTADEKAEAAGDAAVDGGVFTPTPVGKYFFAFYFHSPSTLVTPYRRLLIVCRNDQHQGKWVALLDRKGSGHVQVNGKTISKYSFCFLNSGDEVVLSQAENNAYLLLESPSDVGTSARKRKLLNIENQVEDALSIAHAFDLSVFSNPCRDLFSLKSTSQLDGLELDSAANICSNNAADFELSIGTGNAKSCAEPFLLAFLL